MIMATLGTADRHGNLDCVKIVLRTLQTSKVEAKIVVCVIYLQLCSLLLRKAMLMFLSCLVENGADVNALIDNDHTPLMIASRKSRVNAVTFLVEHGADMDLQDKKGKTALHYAVRCDSPEVAQKLLTLGATQLKNSQGLTPLLSASNKCNISVLEGLINRQLQSLDGCLWKLSAWLPNC